MGVQECLPVSDLQLLLLVDTGGSREAASLAVPPTDLKKETK